LATIDSQTNVELRSKAQKQCREKIRQKTQESYISIGGIAPMRLRRSAKTSNQINKDEAIQVGKTPKLVQHKNRS